MRALTWLGVFLGGCAAAHAEPEAPPRNTAGTAPIAVATSDVGTSAGSVDDEIVRMVASVDAARLKSDVDKLAGFGTRHSLSDSKSDTRGIGAAARWLKARFDEIAPHAGGRLQVKLADFVAPQGERVPKPWPMQ